MSRGRDIVDSSPSIPGGDSRHPERNHARDRGVPDRSPERTLAREPLRRDALSGLSESERRTLVDVGRFRAVDSRDLDLSARRIRELARQGVLRARPIGRDGSRRIHAVTLSRRARRLLQRRSDTQQALYSGFRQTRQLGHDAALYRLYRHQENKIRKEGGQVRRVVLDQEFKRRVFSDLNRPENAGKSREEHRREVAERHHLQVVDGKIPIPDLRVEYETREGREARVDLELVTDHYRPSQLAEKAQAGFSLYGLGSSDSGQGGTVREERDRMVEILSI